jgi:hypothetical protein
MTAIRSYLLISLPCFAVPAFAQKSLRSPYVTVIDCIGRATRLTASTPPE